jgi:hypothetical protein
MKAREEGKKESAYFLHIDKRFARAIRTNVSLVLVISS